MKPPSQNVRLTISVTPEVHAAYQRLANATNTSISRTMGEWLADTLDAVEFTASKIEEAVTSPKAVMREMHAYALGLAQQSEAIAEMMRSGPMAEAAGRPEGPGMDRPRGPLPPSSNTGGKTTSTRHPKPKVGRG